MPYAPDREVSRSRRRFLKQGALTAAGILFGPDLLRKAFDTAGSLARANPTGASAAFGYVFDVYTLQPLEGVLVTLNGNSMVTGSDGAYFVGDPSSVPEEQLPENHPIGPRRSSGLGCSCSDVARPQTYSGSSAKPLALSLRDYSPGFLYFEKPDTHWVAAHDVNNESGVVQKNATLPRNTSTRYGLALTALQFRQIWHVYDDVLNRELMTYRTLDLPIPVDGDMDSPSDWSLVQASVDRLNAAVDLEMYRVVQGHGYPQQPSTTGIYILHDFGSNVSDPLRNDEENPEYLLGGQSQLVNADFLRSDGKVLDHEIDYRLQNYSTFWYQNGIFNASPSPMNNFNREHLLLLHLLAASKESLLEGHTKNDLIALDYVRLL